jgi:hypothetical protein
MLSPNSSEMVPEMMPAVADTPAKPTVLAKGAEVPHLAVVEPRQVIYTGQFNIVVGDAKQAIAATKKMAEQFGGYMQQMTTDSITVRVPADKFEQAVKDLEKIGSIDSRNIVGQDVTEEYVDLGIRLSNARALQEKLKALLAKTDAVEATLEVEKELSRVTTEIERLEGQLNRLKSQIAYSTLTVHFTAVQQASPELRAKLPFWWLGRLGLDGLMSFPGQ